MNAGDSTPNVVLTYKLGLKPEDLSGISLQAEKVFASKKSSIPAVFNTTLPVFPVRDQQDQSSCVAFSLSTISQNLEYYDTTRLREELSPQFIYNLRRDSSEEGMLVTEAVKLIQKYGVVLEKDYPYGQRIESYKNIPAEIMAIGKKHKMGEMAQVNSLNGLKSAMYQRKAGVLLAFKVYNYSKYFWRQTSEDEKDGIGYHAVTAVGYDDNAKEIAIQNSWGREWGDEGFTTITYDEFKRHDYDSCVSFADVKGSDPFDDELAINQVKKKRCLIS